jgi:hypothetical protein
MRMEGEMKSFPVYQVENGRASRVPVGQLVERRSKDRGDNLAGLLKLAAIQFKSTPNDRIRVDFSGILVEI